ncbi:hypothetical protein [Lacticaseibacillus paracasei]|uniref:hypothetical protein n=1 Tax=Lacticaseibacillus paracasei TaxID=1597 RepID=UPI003DA99A56
MIENILKEARSDSRYPALGIAFVVVVIEHLFIREYVGDAIAIFSHLMDHASLLSVLRFRYLSWTSRIFIETPLIRLSSGMHTIVLAMIDILMWMLLIWALMALSHYKHNYLVISLVFIYPIIQMASAGWMATTINYLWPLSMGSFSFVSLDRIYHHKKVSLITGLLTVLALLFATNFETFGVMYLCILTYFSIQMLQQHRINFRGGIFIFVQYLISIANLALALLSPGNRLRVISETRDNMLDFSNLTLIDKVIIGFNNTFSELTDNSFLFLCFSIMILAVALVSKKHSRIVIGAGIFPLVFILTRTFLKPVVIIYAPKFDQLFNAIADQQRVDAVNYFNFTSYIPFVLYVLIFMSVLIVLLNSFNNLSTGLFLDIVLISGFLTTVAVGFSPTVYVSGQRTFLFLNFVLIYMIIIMYDKCYSRFNSIKYLNLVARWSTSILTVFFVVNNFISIGSTYF